MSRPAVGRRLAWVVALVALPGTASAQGLLEGLTAVLDTRAAATTTRTTSTATGAATTTRLDNVFPRLTVNAETMLFPMLRLSTGGVFESNALFSAAGPDSTITRLRPFFQVRSTSQILSPGFSYFRREERVSSTGTPAFGLIGEDYAAYLGWRPAGLPQTDFQYVRTNQFDAARALQDTVKSFGSILSRYSYRELSLYYLGSSLDTRDRANGVETRQVSNAARVDYSRWFLERRLLWNATYRASRLSVETQARGEGGEVEVPVFASAGVSGLSDTPVTARLASNPLLVDANLTAGAGVNLGLPAAGADSQARNLGLDFLNPTEVNRLLVWVDLTLPPEIANTFAWDLYSSPDNLLWTRVGTVSRVLFGPFDNRFRLDFPAVSARFLKVVTRPLSGTVTDATRYPDILVTEVQAFVTRAPGDLGGRVTRTTQNLNTDVRLRLLSAPALYYEGSYWFNDGGGTGTERQQLSNGVSVTHRFNRVFGAYGRGALEQGRQPEGRRVARVANASLSFDPLSTLTGALLYTGQDERLDDRPNDRHGLTLSTNARLYRGFDVQVGLGWSLFTREGGERLRDRSFTVTATIVPRADFTLSVNYATSTARRTGPFAGPPTLSTRRTFVTLAYDPVPTLHLVAAADLLAGGDQPGRNLSNLSVNWAPFPDGSLQVFLAYNEALRPLEFGTERTLRPGLRWRLSRQSYLDLSYERARTEFPFQTTETEMLSADLRLFF